MNLDELFKDLPATIDFLLDDKKTVVQAGFTLHYSVRNKHWAAGYGKKLTGKKLGIGPNPVSAIKDLIDKHSAPKAGPDDPDANLEDDE